MAVTIVIEDIVTGEAWAYPCERSPVIVGRDRGATIAIARGFISGLHATIRFDDEQITFTDLDSLNGSLVDLQPIPTDHPVKILPESEVIVGKRLRLRVERRAVTTPPDPTRKNPFDLDSKSPAAAPPPRLSTNVLSAEELDEIAQARRAKQSERRPSAALDGKSDSSRPAAPPAEASPSGSPLAHSVQPTSAQPRVAPADVGASTAAPAPEPDAALEPGMLPPKTRLGRYYIVRLVARGGMGAVYRAEDPETEQAVAIKTLAPELASKPEARARFLREAKVACRVTHRNIIKIFGYDIHDEIPYLIMEYLRGEGLHTLLDRGPLAIERVAGIGAAVCAGMSAVHEHGIVHRDLKPSNIFLADTDEGQLVKVLDFGVSKAPASRDPFRTGMNAIIGSLPYMSPEQALGGIELDGRSDQFSLGVILYECLTGHRPHHGETPYTLSENIVHGRFEPPIVARPEISAELNDVIMKSMSTSPGDRYESLRELGIDLLPFSSAQAQRQLTDLLSGGPHRISRLQVSAPIPADWYPSDKPPFAPRSPGTRVAANKPLPRTETGVVQTGQAFASREPIQPLVGRTQILVEEEGPGGGQLERWGRRPTPPTEGGALVPFAPPVAWPPGRATVLPAKPQRPVSLLHAAAFVTAGFAMGAVALWLITPRLNEAESPAAADMAKMTASQPMPAPPSPRVAPPPIAPPVVVPPPSAVAARPVAGPPPALTAATAPPIPARTMPAPAVPTTRAEAPPPSRREPKVQALARPAARVEAPSPPKREPKRMRSKAKAAPHPTVDEPARTKNGVRILE